MQARFRIQSLESCHSAGKQCSETDMNCCLQISFVEIHQDDVRDLLGDGENYAPIHVRENPERGTYLENAS